MPARRRAALLAAILTSAAAALCVACSQPPKPPPKLPPKPPLRPLTTAEMQTVISGGARLAKRCRAEKAATGLYVVRLFIAPSGRVSRVQHIAAPTRAADPGRYSGVARYIGAGAEAENPVTRCFAAALGKLRFRKFAGPTVGFDHPIVVERLPPSEPQSKLRKCESDDDCTFRPRRPCTCRPCGETWRRAVSRKGAKKLRKRHRKRRRRCRRRWRRRRKKRCKPCKEPLRWRGKRALCIDNQCSVR